jgi:Uri superfamily endonuclease
MVIIDKIKSYVLIIKAKRSFRKRIGARGLREFKAGYYFYVGSGKKQLVQRIKRHLRMKKKQFWHIDYLLASPSIAIRDIYVSTISEDDLADRMDRSGLVEPYDNYFGASDSSRVSHLFYCRSYGEMNSLRKHMDSWL